MIIWQLYKSNIFELNSCILKQDTYDLKA